MPVYEYECPKCSKRWEEWMRMSDPPPEKCPECGEPGPERIISLTSAGDVEMNPRELYERKIKPEAKEIAERIKKGDQDAAADVFGEG